MTSTNPPKTTHFWRVCKHPHTLDLYAGRSFLETSLDYQYISQTMYIQSIGMFAGGRLIHQTIGYVYIK